MSEHLFALFLSFNDYKLLRCTAHAEKNPTKYKKEKQTGRIKVYLEIQALISTETEYLGLGYQNSVDTFETAFHLFSAPYFERSGRVGTGYQHNKESYPAVKNGWKSINMRIEPVILGTNYSGANKLVLPLALSNQT